MRTSATMGGRFRPGPDFRRGVAFALLSIGVFVALVALQRPHWANPWLLASVFTFGLWLTGKKPIR